MRLRFRKIKIEDAKMLYEWVMDEDTRKSAPNPEPFSFEEHHNWLIEQIKNPNSLIYIVENKNYSVGQLRFQLQLKNEIVCSIVLNPSFRGKGLGKKILSGGIQELLDNDPMQWKVNKCKILASIKASNVISMKLFKAVGFYKIKKFYFKDHLFYQYQLKK